MVLKSAIHFWVLNFNATLSVHHFWVTVWELNCHSRTSVIHRWTAVYQSIICTHHIVEWIQCPLRWVNIPDHCTDHSNYLQILNCTHCSSVLMWQLLTRFLLHRSTKTGELNDFLQVDLNSQVLIVSLDLKHISINTYKILQKLTLAEHSILLYLMSLASFLFFCRKMFKFMSIIMTHEIHEAVKFPIIPQEHFIWYLCGYRYSLLQFEQISPF